MLSRECQGWIKTTGIMLMLWLLPAMAFSQVVYDYEVVARTGETIVDPNPDGGGNLGPISGLGRGPSINDAGKVAFIAGAGTDVRLLLKSDTVVDKNLFIFSTMTVSDDVQVNNLDQISFRFFDNRVGAPTSGDTEVVRLDTVSGSNPVIARGSDWFTSTPFNFVNHWTSINNSGRVLVNADLKSGGTVLAADDDEFGPGPDEQSPALGGFPDLVPMVSDNNRVAVRWGNTEGDDLLVFSDRPLTTAWVVAAQPEYTRIGQRPAISDDGRVVVYMAEHSTLGTGIFYAVIDNSGQVFKYKLVSIMPGTDINQRLGVNRIYSSSTNDYRVAYLAKNTSGQLGLYSADVNVADVLAPVLSNETLLAQQGSTFGNFIVTVQDLDIYDPVNNNGQITFWARTTGSQVIIRAAHPLNKVQWENGIPIVGAEIEAYYFEGTSEANAVIKPLPLLGAKTLSRADGSFILPPELINQPLQPQEIANRRGVRAKITYTEITQGTELNPLGTTQIVINYPDWDPLRPFQTATTEGLDIVFPSPVFFNAGVTGRVNNNSADRNLRAFLTTDSGATDGELQTISTNEGIALNDLKEWVEIKKGLSGADPIPSFVYFAMPSKKSCFGIASDDITWGYDNCIPQSENRINSSVAAILAHFSARVKPQIVSLSPGNADKVPFHFLGHSMGGVILRAVINSKNRVYPQLGKYVTFDSPHGGNAYAGNSIVGFIDDFWSEALMNGTNDITNAEPIGDNWGWNNNFRLTFEVKTKIYYSSLNNIKLFSRVVTPDASAFGVGRIMRPTSILNPFTWFSEQPNGFCERFLHGWTMQVTDEDHSIQGAPQVIVSAARFLAADPVPQLGTRADPGVELSSAVLEQGVGGVCAVVNEPFRSIKRYKINVSDQGTQQQQLKIPAGEQVTVKALLSGVGAQLKLVDSNNIPLTFTPTSTQFTDNVFVLEASLTVPVNGAKWELTSGAANEDALSIIEVVLTNATQRGIAGAADIHNNVGDSVSLNMEVVDSSGVVATGTGGTGQITVIKPDGTEVLLSVFDDGAHNDAGAGDGIFGAVFAETQPPGRYFFRGDLDLSLSGGNLLSRSAEGMFYVDSDAVITNLTTAERLVDDDSDGKWDVIAVDFSFNISKTGSFRLSSQVFDGVNLVSYLESNFAVTDTQVSQLVTLRIPAETVLKSANGGPFILKELDVSDIDRSLFVQNFADYQTAAYLKMNFDIPSAPVLFISMPSYEPISGGNTILLIGQNLADVSAVFFGTQPAPSFVVVDDKTLSVVVPAWDGVNKQVDIRVVTPWNETSKAGIFEYFTPNRPPVLTPIGNKTATEGQPLAFSVTATDPDGDLLTMTARLGNGDALSTIGAAFTDNGNNTGSFSWTPTIGQAGLNPVVVFSAIDPSAASASEIISITVQPPVTVSVVVSPTSIQAGQAVTVSWSNIAAPTPKDWLALYVPGSPNNNTFKAWKYTTGTASGSVSFTVPASLAAGTYEIRLYSNDSYTLLATSNALTVQ